MTRSDDAREISLKWRLSQDDVGCGWVVTWEGEGGETEKWSKLTYSPRGKYNIKGLTEGSAYVVKMYAISKYRDQPDTLLYSDWCDSAQ